MDLYVVWLDGQVEAPIRSSQSPVVYCLLSLIESFMFLYGIVPNAVMGCSGFWYADLYLVCLRMRQRVGSVSIEKI